ncbi:MAG: 23S rRNA (pseudouridine(1915)-N(3))-methyltransferase RlmH [Candidatus Gastranaerophilales bacterium]|nr:23S rRNA (pseudouridine(1915)-N(3))-methyltransferase RlmH [Candidatus Gastranaerophilales bacterium]
MNIKIIAVGKIKEDYVKTALNDYIKRLSPYYRLTVTEIPAEQIMDESLAEKYKEIEANKILSDIKSESFVITLEIAGKNLSSEEFAAKIKDISYSGYNELIFIIGGANGLHKKVSDIADFKLSFSKMTFTHQLIRLILTEQIYRAAKINANEPYHR